MIKYFFFSNVSNLLILTAVIDGIVIWEAAYVLTLNGAKLEFGCTVELVDHCPILTRQVPCSSSGRSKHRSGTYRVVYDAHGVVSILHF